MDVSYRHKKRGSEYNLIAVAEVQCTEPIKEGDRIVIYRSKDSLKYWARPEHEFHDGRFVPITKPVTET